MQIMRHEREKAVRSNNKNKKSEKSKREVRLLQRMIKSRFFREKSGADFRKWTLLCLVVEAVQRDA